MASITLSPQVFKDAIEVGTRLKVTDPDSGMRQLTLDPTGKRSDLRNVFLSIQNRIARAPASGEGALRDEELRVALVYTHQCCVKLNKRLSIWNVSFWVTHAVRWLWTGFQNNSIYQAENLYKETVELRDACEAVRRAAAGRVIMQGDRGEVSGNRKAYHAFIQHSWKGDVDAERSLPFLRDDIFSEDLDGTASRAKVKQNSFSRKTIGLSAVFFGGAAVLLRSPQLVNQAVNEILGANMPALIARLAIAKKPPSSSS